MREYVWNPWHGCCKYSEGCLNCYVYRRDSRVGLDASAVKKNSCFGMPTEKKRNGDYKIPSGTHVWCCMTSDFFLDTADKWRGEAWDMIRERSDLHFNIITKRITRFYECIPADWGNGYDNVSVCCTVENQKRALERLPVFASAPIKEKFIVCEPILGRINLSPYLEGIRAVIAGGESGIDTRVCDFDWILDLRSQCVAANVAFRFKQTGARFLKDGKLYHIERKLQHSQARLAGVNFSPKETR